MQLLPMQRLVFFAHLFVEKNQEIISKLISVCVRARACVCVSVSV